MSDYHSIEKFPNSNFWNLQFPVKIINLSQLEQMKYGNINVFEFTSNIDFSPMLINQDYQENQIDILIYKHRICFITISCKFCKRNKTYENLCRRCLHTYGSQFELENILTRCIQQETCKLSYANPDEKRNLMLGIWLQTVKIEYLLILNV